MESGKCYNLSGGMLVLDCSLVYYWKIKSHWETQSPTWLMDVEVRSLPRYRVAARSIAMYDWAFREHLRRTLHFALRIVARSIGANIFFVFILFPD